MNPSPAAARNPAPGAPASAFPPPRVTPDAWHALGGFWHLATRRYFTARHWLVVLGGLGLLFVFSLPATETSVDAARDFLPWSAGFYVCFAIPLLAFVNAAGAVRDDLRPASVDYLFTRPLTRPVYIGCRYLVQLGTAQLDFLLPFALVAGIGAYWTVPGLADALPRLFLGQVAAIVVFTAVGLLCGLVTSRYVIVGLVYGAVIEIGLGSVPTQLAHISLVRHLLGLLRPLLGEGGWALASPKDVALMSTPGVLAVFLGVALAALAAAAALLSFREFTGTPAREV